MNVARREERLFSSQNRAQKEPTVDKLAITVLLVNFFLIMFVYILLETIIVPMVKDLYAWSSEFAIKTVGIALSGVGVLAFFMFFLTGMLVKRFDERKLYLFMGLAPLMLGMVLHIPMGSNFPVMQNCSLSNPTSTSIANDSSILSRAKRALFLESDDTCDALGCPIIQQWCLTTPIIELPQLIIANIVAVIGYPVAFALTSGIYSKMISSSKSGMWMGFLTSTGSFSRMLGPIFVTAVYSQLGTRWTFGILSVAMVFTFVCGMLVFKRLVPLNTRKVRDEAPEAMQESEPL